MSLFYDISNTCMSRNIHLITWFFFLKLCPLLKPKNNNYLNQRHFDAY